MISIRFFAGFFDLRWGSLGVKTDVQRIAIEAGKPGCRGGGAPSATY